VYAVLVPQVEGRPPDEAEIVQRAQRGDDLIRCAASDHPPRDRPDPQRGQRRKRNALRHLRAGVISGGHGR